jgi:DNA-binding transcriptional LysR family regulator
MPRKVVAKEPCGGFRLQWLDTFVRLARTLNQPAVAREIGGSQATVSRQVAALERWLGRALVSGAAPVQLTEEGKQFATVAAALLEQLADCRADPAIPAPPPPKLSGKDIVI